MAVRDVLWLQAGNYTGGEDRMLLAALTGARWPVDLTPSTSPMVDAGGGHGVVAGGDLAVTTGAGMTVSVAAGQAMIRGTQQGDQGVYVGSNDAAVSITISAADATNPRKDLIVFRVRDAEYGISGDNGVLEATAGTPTGGLTAGNATGRPTPPENALVLAEVFVPAGAGSSASFTVTDLRTRASTLGGVHVCTSTTRPNPVASGKVIYETDSKNLLVYDGTNWTPAKNVHGGTLGYAQRTTSAGPDPFSTITDVADLSVTVTAPANRRLRITGYAPGIDGTVAGDVFGLYVRDGANTQLNRTQLRVDSSSVGNPGSTVMAVVTPSAGTVTYKLSVLRLAGTGNATFTAGATHPLFILVEDIGGV